MLALSLRPGVSLGPFALGCLVNEALIVAKQNPKSYGCVELKYFGQGSKQQDVFLNFPEHGLHLVFDGASQRLRLLELFDLSRMQVTQGSATVGGSAHPPTIEAVYGLAGPTYPGHVDTHHGVYVMHWPGLLILFPLNALPAASWQDMQQGRAPPTALADGRAPVACRMCIHAGNAVSLDELAQVGLPPVETSVQQQVGVRIGKGLFLDDTQQELCFGDTPQDAWSALGAPSGTCSKSSTANPHGSFTPTDRQHQTAADYFYNYFDRGLDLLFCGWTHSLKKIVLHTNLPNHVSFGIYNKCRFAISLDALKTANTEHKQQTTSACHLEGPPDDNQHLSSASFCHHQQHQPIANILHDKQMPHVSQSQADEDFSERKQQAQLQEDCSHIRQLPGMELPGMELPGMDSHSAWGHQAQVPVQHWLNQAKEADDCLPGSDDSTSQSASDAIQQALLKDIMAMTRAGSGSASSSSSQTHQDTADTLKAGDVRSRLRAAPNSAALSRQQGDSHEEQCKEGQSNNLQEASEEGGQAEGAAMVHEGWGWGSEGLTQGSAGASNLDGWDETDPMAVLSQSAQLQAIAQDCEPLQSTQQSSAQAESQQRILAEQLSTTGSRSAATANARNASGIQSHKLPSVQAYRPVSSESQSMSNTHSSNASDSYPQGGPSQQDWFTDQCDPRGSSTTARPALVGSHHARAMDVFIRDSYSPNGACHLEAGSSVPSNIIPEKEASHYLDSAVPESRSEQLMRDNQATGVVLTAESCLADVEHVLGQGDRAVIHTRGLGGDPFGPTMVYGYPGIVVEATQAGCIASVTLFDV